MTRAPSYLVDRQLNIISAAFFPIYIPNLTIPYTIYLYIVRGAVCVCVCVPLPVNPQTWQLGAFPSTHALCFLHHLFPSVTFPTHLAPVVICAVVSGVVVVVVKWSEQVSSGQF